VFLCCLQVLCKYAKPISDDQLTREALLGPKEDERPLSDYQLAWEYFGKWHVLLAVLSLLIVVVHIAFVTPKMKKFLTSWGIDLPDSLGEMFFAAIVVLQVENVVKMIYQFVRARYWQCKCIHSHGMVLFMFSIVSLSPQHKLSAFPQNCWKVWLVGKQDAWPAEEDWQANRIFCPY